MKTIEEIIALIKELKDKIKEYEFHLKNANKFSDIEAFFKDIDKLDSIVINEIHELEIDALKKRLKPYNFKYNETHNRIKYLLSEECLKNNGIIM